MAELSMVRMRSAASKCAAFHRKHPPAALGLLLAGLLGIMSGAVRN